MVKNLPIMRETRVRSLGQEDASGEGHGNPLQYSCLENPMDRGAWWATKSSKESDMTEGLTLSLSLTSVHRRFTACLPGQSMSVENCKVLCCRSTPQSRDLPPLPSIRTIHQSASSKYLDCSPEDSDSVSPTIYQSNKFPGEADYTGP